VGTRLKADRGHDGPAWLNQRIAEAVDVSRPEAQLVILVCGVPPEGHIRWTLRLLTDSLGELAVVVSCSPETVSGW
jgi:hypothetical protein